MQFSTEHLLRITEKGNPASLFMMQMGNTVCQHVTLSRQSYEQNPAESLHFTMGFSLLIRSITKAY